MQAYAKEHPPRDSVGLIPLTDLGTGNYLGEQGGLYLGGVNTPPTAHIAMPREDREVGRAAGQGRTEGE